MWLWGLVTRATARRPRCKSGLVCWFGLLGAYVMYREVQSALRAAIRVWLHALGQQESFPGAEGESFDFFLSPFLIISEATKCCCSFCRMNWRLAVTILCLYFHRSLCRSGTLSLILTASQLIATRLFIFGIQTKAHTFSIQRYTVSVAVAPLTLPLIVILTVIWNWKGIFLP